MRGPGEDRESKRSLRARLLAARRLVPADQRAREAKALVRALRGLAEGPVCAYVPVGAEPGSLALLDALGAEGHRVLLPVVTGPRALDWADYLGAGALVPGPHGLREPGGPRLGPAAIGLAATILVPALAVDRRGVRLGRGGGHYDRSLPLAGPAAARLAVVRDDEVVDLLPEEAHDVPMTGALTPSGLVRFGGPSGT